LKLPLAILKRDPAALLQKTRAELTAAKTALVDLERQRGKALAGAAEIVAIRAIDRHAEEGRATVDLLEDRIVRLTKAAREAERQRLVAARDRAVTEIVEPEFRKIETLAARLQSSIKGWPRVTRRWYPQAGNWIATGPQPQCPSLSGGMVVGACSTLAGELNRHFSTALPRPSGGLLSLQTLEGRSR
jgi:hypothetical protein